MRNVITANVDNYMGYINTSFDTERLFSDYEDMSNITLYDIFSRLPVKSMFIEHIGNDMPKFVQEIRKGISSNAFGDFIGIKLMDNTMIFIAFIRFNDGLATAGSDIYWRLYQNNDRGWDQYWHRIDRIDIGNPD